MKTETARKVAAAGEQAQVFLLPPYESPSQRADALLACSETVRQAIEPAVRAGRDELAQHLLELAQNIEASK